MLVYIHFIVNESLFKSRLGAVDLDQVNGTQKKGCNAHNAHNGNGSFRLFRFRMIDALEIILRLSVGIFTGKILFKVIIISCVSLLFFVVLLRFVVVIVAVVATVLVIIVDVVVVGVVVVGIVVVVVIVVVVIVVVVVVVITVGLFSIVVAVLDHTDIVANGAIFKLILVALTNFLVVRGRFAFAVAKATPFSHTGAALIFMEFCTDCGCKQHQQGED